MAWINEFKRLFSERENSLSEIASNMRDLGTWQTLLNYLKEEEYGTKEERESDPKATHQLIFGHEIGDNSVIDQFDNTIDLNLDIENNLTWNESVNAAVNIWKSLKQGNLSWKVLDGENETFTIAAEILKKADAGNKFVEDGIYVVPFSNIDSQTYTEVRGNDGVESVLTSQRNLQFTRIQSDEARFLRLIMPKYTRRVEIEDLNRNFWVIGQTITGISSYLFGANSPLGNLLNSILSEIVQLWENVMYLWAQMAILTGEAPIKVIYLPMPNNPLQPQRKYDNFTYNDGTSILDRVRFLADKYPKNSLVIVPYSRYVNYSHNYFSHYAVRCIVFYNKITNQWTQRWLVSSGHELYNDDGSTNIYQYNIEDHTSELTTLSIDSKDYKVVRPIPTITASYSGINICITDFQIKMLDVASGNCKILTKSASTYNNWTDASTGAGEQEYNNKTYYYVHVHLESAAQETSYSKVCYLGDCVSREVSS